MDASFFVEALTKGLARKLSRLELNDCDISQRQFNQILSNIDSSKITSLAMTSNFTGYGSNQTLKINKEEEHKQTKMTCHFISSFVKLKELKISFEYVSEEWFKLMGDTLITMGKKLKILHLLLNKKIENNCVPF